jgi:hypothetical protein
MGSLPKKRRRKTQSREQAFSELVRLCDYYGTSSKTALEAIFAVYLALQDGLVRVPPHLHRRRKRGPRPIWEGPIGLELLSDVEKVRRAAGGELTDYEAITKLQESNSKKWGEKRYPNLDKRYYDAKRYEADIRRQFAAALMRYYAGRVRNLTS